MKITVVTVCYNEKTKIRQTIESVVNQSYKDIEYILVDGGSSDGTVSIIKEYMNLDDRLKLISEPDSGIYNAMNKGISIASGEYINFMNAGDVFFDLDVIKKVIPSLIDEKPDVFCGYSYIFIPNSRVGRLVGRDCQDWRAMLEILDVKWVNHQAVFSNTLYMKTNPFCEKYRIAADWDWFIKSIKKRQKIVYRKNIICKYIMDGVSAKECYKKQNEEEIKDILITNYGLIVYVFIRKLLPLLRFILY